ncbi:DUF6976 family protein [Ampullimonas aquatilis]|uniref:DUF6976 family protein n=1 Tax=Ampullimonas aquatilis TaxID=1341549 RepID=UPI003C76C370
MNNLPGKLYSLEEAVGILADGRPCTVAADIALLKKLPKGNWIGGSIPYFIGQDGGTDTKEKIFIHELPDTARRPNIRLYDKAALPTICQDAPENGFSILILPAFSEAHQEFAKNAPSYEDMYMKPLIGWISGMHLNDLGNQPAFVINGQTGEVSNDQAIVLHLTLPNDSVANIGIINLFNQGEGDSIQFLENGFKVRNCLINGKLTNLAQYLTSQETDTKLPLVADYSGALINVSFQSVNTEKGFVEFYAPVFTETEYKIAAKVDNYVQTFQKNIPEDTASTVFSCNCILNYLYSELAGKKTGNLTGPITFGEIAYQLLNQTLVYLTIDTI